MIESGVYSFIFNLIKDSLPSPIRNLDLSTLDLLKNPLIKGYINLTAKGLGDIFVDSVETHDINFEFFINGAIELLLKDQYPADNNLVIDKESLEVK